MPGPCGSAALNKGYAKDNLSDRFVWREEQLSGSRHSTSFSVRCLASRFDWRMAAWSQSAGQDEQHDRDIQRIPDDSVQESQLI